MSGDCLHTDSLGFLGWQCWKVVSNFLLTFSASVNFALSFLPKLGLHLVFTTLSNIFVFYELWLLSQICLFYFSLFSWLVLDLLCWTGRYFRKLSPQLSPYLCRETAKNLLDVFFNYSHSIGYTFFFRETYLLFRSRFDKSTAELPILVVSNSYCLFKCIFLDWAVLIRLFFRLLITIFPFS